eukprot:UN05466
MADHFSYGNEYRAVASQVSSMLLTKHVLYIGESFQDRLILRYLDQIHRIEIEKDKTRTEITRLTLKKEEGMDFIYPQTERIEWQSQEDELVITYHTESKK